MLYVIYIGRAERQLGSEVAEHILVCVEKKIKKILCVQRTGKLLCCPFFFLKFSCHNEKRCVHTASTAVCWWYGGVTDVAEGLHVMVWWRGTCYKRTSRDGVAACPVLHKNFTLWCGGVFRATEIFHVDTCNKCISCPQGWLSCLFTAQRCYIHLVMFQNLKCFWTEKFCMYCLPALIILKCHIRFAFLAVITCCNRYSLFLSTLYQEAGAYDNLQ